jgi:hypothetical protein
MKILLMFGGEVVKKTIKSKTLQNSNTKAVLATVGQFEGDFI